jgi:hypothetical protein
MQPLRAQNGDRRGAEVLQEQAPQMPAADADAAGELLDVALVEVSLRDQPQRAGDGCRGALPCRSPRGGLRAAATTRTEAGW